MKKNGFTLIELLISTVIFTVTALSLYTALNVGILSYKKMNFTFNVYQSADIALTRMKRDISNAFIYSRHDARFKGTPDTMDFFSVVDEFSNGKAHEGVRRIGYSFKNGILSRTSYAGVDAIEEKTQAQAEALSSDINHLTFEYACPPNNEKAPYLWQNFWPKENAMTQRISLPLAVRIRLSVARKNEHGITRATDFSRVIALHTNT